MWYFSWILGVCLAGGVGVLNAMWFEIHSQGELIKSKINTTSKVED